MQHLSANETLIDHLHQLIADKKGSISFAEYMDIVLYHPQFGFYNAHDFEIGVECHAAFATAPTLSPLFAQCIANQCLQIFAQMEMCNADILELGAGSGQLAYDLLQAFAKENTLPTHYYIYDPSYRLQTRQRALLQTLNVDLLARVVWLEKLPEKFSGVVIANEVLDALACHCFRIGEKTIAEKCVTTNMHQADTQTQMYQPFNWLRKENIHGELHDELELLRKTYALPVGYESEINLQLKTFISALAEMMQNGVVLCFDYGYGQREYYHPQRSQGTLTTLYQRLRLDNPLQFPGQQDITAHVDFTRVADCAIDAGFALAGYTTQASFLLATDIINLALKAAHHLSPHDCFKMQQAIKYLTLPTEMGERVKVMALRKTNDTHYDPQAQTLLGFGFKDNRREL